MGGNREVFRLEEAMNAGGIRLRFFVEGEHFHTVRTSIAPTRGAFVRLERYGVSSGIYQVMSVTWVYGVPRAGRDTVDVGLELVP